MSNFKKELARDFLAIGSWVFFILVLARAMIKPYRPFVDQIAIAGIILILITLILKNYDDYIARGLILVVFTSIFYQDKLFTTFIIMAMIGLIITSHYLEKNNIKIIKGIIIGIITTAISYYLANITINIL